MSVGTPTINIPTVGKNNKSKISIGYKKAYNYVIDVTSPYGNVLSATEDNGEAQRYTYGLDVISVNAVKNSISGKKNEKDYYLQDELGSPLKLLDEKGSTLSGYSYSTFGTPSVITYLEGFCDDQNIFGFTGYQYDQASGLMYAQARYYLEVGRFTSKDSYKGNIDNPITLNAYLYANSNPERYIDPSGHESIYSKINELNPHYYLRQQMCDPENREKLHNALDLLACIPVIGAPCDLINCVWYSSEENWTSATVCAIGLIPFAGDIAEIGKDGYVIIKDGVKGAGKAGRMTTKQATAAAKELGYQPTNYVTKSGEKVFYNSKTKQYISQDVGSGNGMGSHNGGVWKAAKSPEGLNSKSTRLGTYDANMNRIGD